MMEKSIRSAPVEGEEETLLWWKCMTTLLVLLSYTTLVVRCIPEKFHGVQVERAFVLDEQALLSALNLSSSLRTISTTCENFLLTGDSESNDESERVPIQGWSDGEWHHPPESSDFDWLQQPRTMGGSVGHHGASFSVNQAAHGWPEWSSCSMKTPVHAVEGHLELKNFWDWNPSMKAVMLAEASGAEVDFKQMLAIQDLKVFLKGSYVDTNAGRRLCMTGCAFRNDHSYQIDCGFNLKMKYPTRQATSLTRQIEAELSSTRTSGAGALRFPAVRIHKDIVNTEYTSKVTYLRSALDLNKQQIREQQIVNYNAHLHRHPRTIHPPAEINLEDYYDDTYSGYH